MNDWHLIINDLKEGNTVSVDPERWNLGNPEYRKILDIWKNANFNLSSIKWTNYYPGIHFSSDVEKNVSEYIGFRHVHRSWISKIDPGFMAPWHWDVDDNEDEYLRNGPIIRYTVMIEDMAHGHILIVGDEHYYNQKQNTTIKWQNHREWHSGINAGMTPNYLFHILGY